MKKSRIIPLMLVFTLLLGLAIPTLAATKTTKQMTAEYSGIQITLDGKKVDPKDVNGASVDPFIVDGTTYLPVRALANALGLNVDWDQETQTVVLTTPEKEPPITPTSTADEPSDSDVQILRKVEADGLTVTFFPEWKDGDDYYAAAEIENTSSELKCYNFILYALTESLEGKSIPYVLDYDNDLDYCKQIAPYVITEANLGEPGVRYICPGEKVVVSMSSQQEHKDWVLVCKEENVRRRLSFLHIKDESTIESASKDIELRVIEDTGTTLHISYKYNVTENDSQNRFILMQVLLFKDGLPVGCPPMNYYIRSEQWRKTYDYDSYRVYVTALRWE